MLKNETSKLIDTHNHLYLEAFDEDRDQLILLAKESGIGKLLLPNVDLQTIDRMHALCDQEPYFVRPMMGLHPTSVDQYYKDTLSKIEAHLGNRNYCAIGEIGLDLYWDKTFLKEQIDVFEKQLQWCIELNLPAVIHCREAHAYVIESINKIGNDKLHGVFHSFTGTLLELEEIKNLKNFKIGINGVITFKNSNLRNLLNHIELDRIVIETDAPYLSPVPYRGRRNEPQYIWKTVEAIATTYNISIDDVVQRTTKNALSLFNGVDSLI